MASTVVIEIPINAEDNTSSAVNSATKNVVKLEKTVSKFDQSQQKTQKSLKSWMKQKYQLALEAKDRISPILKNIKTGMSNIFRKSWSVTMSVIDKATAPIRGIFNLLKNPIVQAGAVLGITIGMKDTIDTFKTFEATMSKVQAISSASDADLHRLTKKAEQMGSTTKFTATEAGEAFSYMAMAGWKTEDMLGGIEGILSLAAASGEDLGTTSDIVTDALTAFKLTAADAGHFSDVLAQASSNANTNVSMMGETFKYAGAMAGTLGYSIEDVALAVGLMANSGIKASTAGTELNGIFTRLSVNTNGARDAIEELGIKFFDDAGKARKFSDVLKELRTATAKYTNQQKTEIANTIAGQRAQAGLLAMLNATDADFRKLEDSVNHADGASKRMADTMLNNLAGSMTLLQSAVDGVKISFGERLAPYVKDFAEWLTNKTPDIDDALSKLMDNVDKKVDKLKEKFKKITSSNEWKNASFFGKGGILLDKFILDPMGEWWNRTGKAKMASFVGKIGKGIGTGLKFGILTLLGIDVSDTVNEATSIGASFAKGFADGFDFDAVSAKLWDGFKNLFRNASKLLPGGEKADLSSVMSFMMLNRILSPAFGLGRGILGLGGNIFGLGKTVFSSGNGGLGLGSLLLGSAAAGTGLLGKSAMFAIDLGAGELAGGAVMGNAGFTAIGGGAAAGALIGGTTLISGGMDLYQAIKSVKDKEKASAYAKSSGWKAGGVAAGATAGALIGGVIPGIGHLAGGLIGAGIGGIVGLVKGNSEKAEYEKKVAAEEKKAQEQALKANKALTATGLSIDKVKFKSKELNSALKDSSVSAQEFAVMFDEEVKKKAVAAFGDVKLSLTEMKAIAEKITLGDAVKNMGEFKTASEAAKSAFENLQSSIETMNKENWKISFNMKLSETELSDYRDSVDDFVKNAKQYIEDNHYDTVLAINLLTDGKIDTATIDSIYESLKNQLDEVTKKLSDTLTLSLSDGFISVDEAAVLKDLQAHVTNITNKINTAKTEASLDVLKTKYTSGADLSYETFKSMQEELKAQVQSAEEGYKQAFQEALVPYIIQKNDGSMSESEYKQMYQQLENDFNSKMGEINVRVQDFNLNTIADVYAKQLDGILPYIEGTTKDKLSSALQKGLALKPDPMKWTEEDVRKWFDLGNIDAETFGQLFKILPDVANQYTETNKKAIIDAFKKSLPTAEELKKSIDWQGMDSKAVNDMFRTFFPNMTFGDFKAGTFFDENMINQYSQQLAQALQNAGDNTQVQEWLSKYYKPNLVEVQKSGEDTGTTFTNGVSNIIGNSSPLLRSKMQGAINSAVASPFTVNASIRLNTTFTNGLPLLPSINDTLAKFSKQTIIGHASGGYVSGGPQLSWLAEEGYGEFVIPTAPNRRNRALELYEQAGDVLGVSRHAEGGVVGTVSEAGVSVATNNGTTVQVNVQVSPEFNVSASNADEDTIMAIIKKNMKSMADELGGEIADKLEQVFFNMPVKEA